MYMTPFSHKFPPSVRIYVPELATADEWWPNKKRAHFAANRALIGCFGSARHLNDAPNGPMSDVRG